MPVYTEMSYASIVEHDSFSTVHILVEGDKGFCITWDRDLKSEPQHRHKTVSEIVKFPAYPWADPDYIVNHESGIPLCRNILADMLKKGKAENTGDDNFETVKLVWACYQSAESGKLIRLDDFNR